jgi:hypothetical protein
MCQFHYIINKMSNHYNLLIIINLFDYKSLFFSPCGKSKNPTGEIFLTSVMLIPFLQLSLECFLALILASSNVCLNPSILEIFKNFFKCPTNGRGNASPFFYGLRLNTKDVGILQLLIVLESMNKWSESMA